MRFRPLALVLALLSTCQPAYATVSATPTNVSYAGNGATTVFPVVFPFFSSTDLLVQQTISGVTSTVFTGYTVSGGNDATGNVTFLAAPANGTTITITRSTPSTQTTSFLSQGSFTPRIHERAFDKLTLMVQELVAKEAADVAALTAGQASLRAVAEGGTFTGNKTITGNLTVNGGGGITAANGPLLGTYLSVGNGAEGVPTMTFISSGIDGFYLIGAHDVGLQLNGTKFIEWLSSGETHTYTGSATQSDVALLQPSLANGNRAKVVVGKADTANNSGVLSFSPNATAANSISCLNVNGQTNTLCVDGNGKTYIGTASAGLTNESSGSWSINFGTILDGDCGVQTEPLTGAAVGGVCSVSASGDPLSAPFCRVTGANTIVIEICPAHSITLGALTFTAVVLNP